MKVKKDDAADKIMEQAQCFASAWSLVGGRFDSGTMLDDANEAKLELQKMVEDLASSLDWYRRRVDELQRQQQRMRDPERTMVCDILANGSLLIDGTGNLAADRYAIPRGRQA